MITRKPCNREADWFQCASMPAWEKLGFAALLILALAGCVLIDSCIEDCTYVDTDGDGPEAPIPSFEIASKNPGFSSKSRPCPRSRTS